MAATPRLDLLALFDYVWARFVDRMSGLSSAELAWQPTGDDRLTLRWRLEHIASLLSEERNGRWLGRPAHTFPLQLGPPDPELNACRAAYEIWTGQLHTLDDADLAAPIGAVGGRYGQGSRFSFALHVLDELIHHTAEAALLRDLFPD